MNITPTKVATGIKADNNWYTRTIYLYNVQKGKCYYCENLLYSEAIQDVAMDIDIDHLIPVSRGGKNSLDNFRLTCKSCNNQKSDLTETEYRTALKAIADGKIQKKDINDYGKYMTLKEKFSKVDTEKDDSYKKGREDRNNEIIELAESMKVILDPEDDEFQDFDDGRNIALGSLIRSITTQ